MSERPRGMSMRAVTQLTGISEHLLRAWERRYRVVEPARTAGGTRDYSDDDVARLRWVKQAIDAGHRIGDVAALSNEEIAKRLDLDRLERPEIDALIALVETGAGDGLREELGKLCHWLGPERWACEIASPLSSATGQGWTEGRVSIAQEHMATACLVQVIEAQMLEFAGQRPDAAPRLLFTTPPDELHGLGIQLAGLVAAARGAAVRQLGVQLPSEDVARFAIDTGIDHTIVGAVTLSPPRTRAYFEALRAAMPRRIGLLAGGAATRGFELPKGVRCFDTLTQFGDYVGKLANAS